MGKVRKIFYIPVLILASLISAIGLWQFARITWALLNPPPLGTVFEPIIPLAASVTFLVVGIALFALGRALRRRR